MFFVGYLILVLVNFSQSLKNVQRESSWFEVSDDNISSLICTFPFLTLTYQCHNKISFRLNFPMRKTNKVFIFLRFCYLIVLEKCFNDFF